MDNREKILQAAMELLLENGEQPQAVTVRQICARAEVGLGLVNYHFGSKEKLMEQVVERLVRETVARFQAIREETVDLPPFGKLERLGELTLSFLFGHAAVSRISVLTDMNTPRPQDNTHRTFEAYLPLVAACRPDWDEAEARRRTFCLVTVMQQAFLRQEAVRADLGIDLRDSAQRRAFHTQMLHDILEV